MKKKKYKIIKTDLFKQQEKKLPKEIKKELDSALKDIAKNPMKAQHSMSLFTKPTPEELKRWMGGIRATTIDLVLEYLGEKGCLSKTGKKLASDFWGRYIKDKEMELDNAFIEDAKGLKEASDNVQKFRRERWAKCLKKANGNKEKAKELYSKDKEAE